MQRYDQRTAPPLDVKDGDEVYLRVVMKRQIRHHLERGKGKIINARTCDKEGEREIGCGPCADVWWFDAGWSETVPLLALSPGTPEYSLRYRFGGSEDAPNDKLQMVIASLGDD